MTPEQAAKMHAKLGVGVSEFAARIRAVARHFPEAARILQQNQRRQEEVLKIRMVHGDRAEKLAVKTGVTIHEAVALLDHGPTEEQAMACIQFGMQCGVDPVWVLLETREMILREGTNR